MTPTLSHALKYALVAALGASGMYWLDHSPGRRRARRASRRRKLAQTRHATGAAGRDAQHPSDGAAQEHPLIRSNEVPDDILAERVRVALGRITSRAGAIEVGCSQGVVTLTGAVLKREHPRVMRAARSAAGLSDVHDELAAYRRPDGIWALQRGRVRPKQPQTSWSPTARLLACASGTSLTLWGLRQNPMVALLASGAGSALFVRGASNKTLKRSSEPGRAAQEQRPAASP